MSRIRDNWMALAGLVALVVLVLASDLDATAVVTYLMGLGITAPAVESIKASIKSADDAAA